jgi:hypothetical protein
MTLIPYNFQVLDNNENPVLGLSFTRDGLAAGGAPGIAVLQKDPTVLGGTPTPIVPASGGISFFERGQGVYAALFDPDAAGGDCFLIVDAGSSLSGLNRYIPVPLPRDSSRLLGVTTDSGQIAALGAQALDAVQFPTTDITTLGQAQANLAYAVKFLLNLLTHSALDTAGNYQVYNDAGALIQAANGNPAKTLGLTATGGVQTLSPTPS